MFSVFGEEHCDHVLQGLTDLGKDCNVVVLHPGSGRRQDRGGGRQAAVQLQRCIVCRMPGSIHAAACSLQTARLKAAPGSGWGRWSGPFAAGNRCIPFLLGQARPASVRLAATQTERTPAFPPLQWARPAAWPAASEKYSRLSSTWAAEHLPGAPVLPGTRGRCGTPGLHQTRSRPGRYTAGSEAHRLHRPEGRGQHPAARERTSRVPGLAWHPAAPGSDTGQRDLPW